MRITAASLGVLGMFVELLRRRKVQPGKLVCPAYQKTLAPSQPLLSAAPRAPLMIPTHPFAYRLHARPTRCASPSALPRATADVLANSAMAAAASARVCTVQVRWLQSRSRCAQWKEHPVQTNCTALAVLLAQAPINFRLANDTARDHGRRPSALDIRWGTRDRTLVTETGAPILSRLSSVGKREWRHCSRLKSAATLPR